MMNFIKLLYGNFAYLFLAALFVFSSCEDDNGEEPDLTANLDKYSVGANVNDEDYLTTTSDLLSGSISIVGNGIEGAFGGLSVSKDGYIYFINSNEGTLDKLEITESGLIKVGNISTETLNPGSFYRYIQATDNNDLLLLNFPNEEGKAPFAVIDLDSFTVENHGFFDVPDIGGKQSLWVNAVVKGNKVYFGSLYGDSETWQNLADSLITLEYDYPSLANPRVLVSEASAGTVAGYRTNGSFLDEQGNIYQYNLNSKLWYGHEELADKPTVFVRISNGGYDDYLFDVSAEFSEPISIWNAWYAGNGIVYANVVREDDLVEWDDISRNHGTLAKIDLNAKTVTELNIPKAPYVNIFQLNTVGDGKFYIPVSLQGDNANIYEITVGGGPDDFTKGAALDGSNVYVNSLLRNF